MSAPPRILAEEEQQVTMTHSSLALGSPAAHARTISELADISCSDSCKLCRVCRVQSDGETMPQIRSALVPGMLAASAVVHHTALLNTQNVQSIEAAWHTVLRLADSLSLHGPHTLARERLYVRQKHSQMHA